LSHKKGERNGEVWGREKDSGQERKGEKTVDGRKKKLCDRSYNCYNVGFGLQKSFALFLSHVLRLKWHTSSHNGREEKARETLIFVKTKKRLLRQLLYGELYCLNGNCTYSLLSKKIISIIILDSTPV